MHAGNKGPGLAYKTDPINTLSEVTYSPRQAVPSSVESPPNAAMSSASSNAVLPLHMNPLFGDGDQGTNNNPLFGELDDAPVPPQVHVSIDQ